MFLGLPQKPRIIFEEEEEEEDDDGVEEKDDDEEEEDGLEDDDNASEEEDEEERSIPKIGSGRKRNKKTPDNTSTPKAADNNWGSFPWSEGSKFFEH